MVKDEAKKPVVLLHGLARSSRSMQKMEKALNQAGFMPLNVGYPSRHHRLEALAEKYVRPAIETRLGDTGESVHFVTHSMGGILVRLLARARHTFQIGRVVMLSPPNKGSEVVDALGRLWLFRLLNGPAGEELGTDRSSLPARLGPADFQLGIITGNRSINFFLSTLIQGPNDGKVSVARAGLEGMRDFLVLPVAHPFIMRHPDVIRHTIRFLQTGYF